MIRGSMRQQAPLDFLNRLVEEIPDVADSEAERDYLALLDRCLIDRMLSVTESGALFEFARSHHMSAREIRRLHERYLAALAVAARADGIVTDKERDDLVAVADLLELPLPALVDEVLAGSEKALGADWCDSESHPSGFVLNAGDRVCLTGTMSRERDDWISILGDAGIIVWPSVTKKVKLLVAADPDSLSGKAQKARSYGIPIVGEQWLEERFSA
jgi:DNA polymerase-3 subunit epsilon